MANSKPLYTTDRNPPETLLRTAHSVGIWVGNTQIGLINGFAPTQSMDVTHVYELNPDTSGLPYEAIPGNTKGLTIGINRYDLWTDRMEDVFGTRQLDMLSNQKSPFTVSEKWLKPNGVEWYDYMGCWFSVLGRNIRSDDTRIINVNATITYTYKKRVA